MPKNPITTILLSGTLALIGWMFAYLSTQVPYTSPAVIAYGVLALVTWGASIAVVKLGGHIKRWE